MQHASAFAHPFGPVAIIQVMQAWLGAPVPVQAAAQTFDAHAESMLSSPIDGQHMSAGPCKLVCHAWLHLRQFEPLEQKPADGPLMTHDRSVTPPAPPLLPPVPLAPPVPVVPAMATVPTSPASVLASMPVPMLAASPLLPVLLPLASPVSVAAS